MAAKFAGIRMPAAVLLALFLAASSALSMAASVSPAYDIVWPACRGSTIAECLDVGAGEEFGAELGLGGSSPELSRRILAATGYISYRALRRDSVPCSRRGASYYNCRAGAQANPYTRGCSAITRCRS